MKSRREKRRRARSSTYIVNFIVCVHINFTPLCSFHSCSGHPTMPASNLSLALLVLALLSPLQWSFRQLSPPPQKLLLRWTGQAAPRWSFTRRQTMAAADTEQEEYDTPLKQMQSKQGIDHISIALRLIALHSSVALRCTL